MRTLFIDRVKIGGFRFPRYRYIKPHLPEEIEAELVEVGDSGFNPAALVGKALKVDVVFVRNLLNPWLLRALRAACDRIYLEVEMPDGPDLEEGERKFRQLIRSGKAAKYLLLQSGNHLRVMKKKVLSPGLFPPSSPEPSREHGSRISLETDEGTTILCEGPSSLLSEIGRISHILEKAGDKIGGLMLHLRSEALVKPGNVRFFFEKIDTPYCPPSQLSPRLFIYPVFRKKNDHFGTSPFVLNALARGLACLVPPTELDRRVFRDGESVFLFRTPEEFEEKLDILLRDEGTRRRLGLSGRKIWEEMFSPASAAPFYLKAAKKALESSR